MLGRWDPFVELSRLQDELSRGVGRRVDPRLEREGPRGDRSGYALQPAVDIHEAKDAITVRVELPGVRPEDVQLNVENQLLTISGERRLEKENDVDGYRRVESVYGSFSRSFALPSTVSTEAIDASMEHGVLTLRIPKRTEAQARRIPVRMGSETSKRTFATQADARQGDAKGQEQQPRVS